jgi:hypothetical protein
MGIRSMIHEYRNWERGCEVSFMGIHKSDFLYSVDCKNLTFLYSAVTEVSSLGISLGCTSLYGDSNGGAYTLQRAGVHTN